MPENLEVIINLDYNPGIETKKTFSFKFNWNVKGVYEHQFGNVILQKFEFKRY